MDKFDSAHQKSLKHRLWHKLVGEPRNVNEPSLFHKLSLIPLLAWIGLGADGLSSSAYGPEEAFRTLGSHTYIAVLLGIAMAFTVFIIFAHHRTFPARRRRIYCIHKNYQ